MKSVYCSFFGHNYVVTKKVTLHIHEYECTKCHTQMTTGSNGDLIPLTAKYKEINKVLEGVYKKRRSKRLEGLLVFEH